MTCDTGLATCEMHCSSISTTRLPHLSFLSNDSHVTSIVSRDDGDGGGDDDDGWVEIDDNGDNSGTAAAASAAAAAADSAVKSAL